jgi:periplasmic divalent cation tolerance protein
MPNAPTSSQFVVVLVTCPNRLAGETIGRALVEEHLAACTNVIPGVTSIYRWQGKVCRDREVLLLIKTRRSRFAALTRRVRELHSYAVPEIVAVPVAAGSPPYLAWVLDATA